MIVLPGWIFFVSRVDDHQPDKNKTYLPFKRVALYKKMKSEFESMRMHVVCQAQWYKLWDGPLIQYGGKTCVACCAPFGFFVPFRVHFR